MLNENKSKFVVIPFHFIRCTFHIRDLFLEFSETRTLCAKKKKKNEIKEKEKERKKEIVSLE